jgi:hypothetical protein
MSDCRDPRDSQRLSQVEHLARRPHAIAARPLHHERIELRPMPWRRVVHGWISRMKS